MCEKNISNTSVDSVLIAKAAEDLQAQVKEELLIDDPNPEVVKAVLDGDDEDINSNKRTREG